MTDLAKKFRLSLVFLLLGTVLAPPGHARTKYTTIDVPGAVLTEAFGINNGGQIVGAFYGHDFVTHGFLLSDGVFTQIDFPAATATYATGINDSGQIVGFYTVMGSDHGFLLTGINFTMIDVLGASSTWASGINNQGVVVGYSFTNVYSGFIWNQGVVTTLTDPKASTGGTSATAINNLGDVVGYYGNAAGKTVGFVFKNGRFQDISFPKWNAVVPLGVNDIGRVVGFAISENGSEFGFAFKAGWGFGIINVPRADYTEVLSVNALEQKVGFYQDHNQGAHGFLKTEVNRR